MNILPERLGPVDTLAGIAGLCGAVVVNLTIENAAHDARQQAWHSVDTLQSQIVTLRARERRALQEPPDRSAHTIDRLVSAISAKELRLDVAAAHLPSPIVTTYYEVWGSGLAVLTAALVAVASNNARHAYRTLTKKGRGRS